VVPRDKDKKTYESLFIAVRCEREIPDELKESTIFISVPSLVHSAKPPVIGE